MRVLMINVVCGIRSTGRICTDLATELEKQGHEVKIAYGREKVPEQFQKYAVRIGTDLDVEVHGIGARLFDSAGLGSKNVTVKFIQWIKEYDPDVIHLHNIHGYYINIEVLFNYLRICGKKIIWTLHDCWAFTGHCVYFDYVQCDKWLKGCYHCIQKKEYPCSIGLDKSKRNYKMKQQLFTGISNLILVSPSRWLANLVKQSFMKEYIIKVIHNGIDTEVFKPTESDFRKKYHLENKKIILGVASIWDRRKGLNSFVELSKHLSDEYQIILVGLKEEQIKELPNNIMGILGTDSPEELAAIYTLADVFVNPTLEDNYPTTNIEAIACGTPVISYDTGGSGESAEMYGVSIPQNNLEELITALKNISYIKQKKFDIDYHGTVREYLQLYQE